MKVLTDEMIDQISSLSGVKIYMSEMNKIYTLSDNVAQKLLIPPKEVSEEIEKILLEHPELGKVFCKDKPANQNTQDLFGTSYKIVKEGIFILIARLKGIDAQKAIGDYAWAFLEADTAIRNTINEKQKDEEKVENKTCNDQIWEEKWSSLDKRITSIETTINGLQNFIHTNKEYTVKLSFSDSVDEIPEAIEEPTNEVETEKNIQKEDIKENVIDVVNDFDEKLEKVLPFGDELCNPEGTLPFGKESFTSDDIFNMLNAGKELTNHESVEDTKKEVELSDFINNINQADPDEFKADQERREFLAANTHPITLSALAKEIVKYAEIRKVPKFNCSGSFLSQYCSRRKKIKLDESKTYRKRIPTAEYESWFYHVGGSTPLVTQTGMDKLWLEIIKLINDNTYMNEGFCTGKWREKFISNLYSKGLDLDGNPISNEKVPDSEVE